MAVIKDNAYGHGDIVIANEMECLGIDFFAVSHIDEAIRLRKNGLKSDILILSYTSPYYFELLSKYKLTQTLISLEINTGILHSQNTPAALNFPNFKCDYIRVGSLLLGMIYGGIH